MKASELRNKTVKELNDELFALMKEQFNLRTQRVTSQSTQTHPFKKIRREIARIKTIVREKEGSQ